MRFFITTLLIFFFWFMLSGHTEPLLIFLGVASTLLTVFLARRMEVIDHESYPVGLSLKLFRYYFYLGKEIILANIDVVKSILNPETISPRLVSLPAEKHSDLGKVIYANSITLTPGTVTLSVSDSEIIIHALSKEGANALKTGDMAKAVPEDKKVKGESI